ncbi:hypothetical protein JCM6882_006799 [Rhodosporidiobolus microsporus]
MAGLSKRGTPQPPQTHGLRSLLVLDGNEALPDRSHLLHGAQGGSMAAMQLHEQMRRWVSSTLGEESSGNVQLFVDLAQLSRALRIPTDILHDFARGFSSTPRPSASINCLKSSTHAVMNGHLAFQLPHIDVLFLAGFSADLHSHWLHKLLPLNPSLQVVLLQTKQPPSQGMASLVPNRTTFQGLMDVNPVVVARDITDPPSDVEEGEGILSPTESVAASAHGDENGHQESPQLVARPIRPIESFATATPWATFSNPPSRSASVASSRRPAVQSSTMEYSGGWVEVGRASTAPPAPAAAAPTPPAANESEPEHEPEPDSFVTASEASGSPVLSQAELPKPALAPETVERGSSPESSIHESSSAAPSTSVGAPSVSPSISQAPSSPTKSTAVPVVPQVRPPPVPAQYLPLLRIVLSLEKASPTTPPLWSAVGSALQQSEHKGKYGKLRTYLLDAQRNGWVSTGKGEGEGSEWIKVSQRGVRAMKKVGK